MTTQILEMTDAEYFAINDRCSASSIKGAFQKSPAHYKAEQAKYTDALNFGSIAHKAILEPREFRNVYIVAPKFDKRTKAGKEAFANFEAIKGDRESITQAEQQKIFAMKKAFANHSIAVDILKKANAIEQVILFDLFGVPFKAKLDIICEPLGMVVDYKTTQSAAVSSFRRDFIKYGYDIQAYVYLEAAKAAGYKVDKFVSIPQEKEAPFAVNVFNTSDDALDLGHFKTEELCQRWYECFESDVWPCYEQEIHQLELSAWDQKQLDDLTMGSLDFT